ERADKQLDVLFQPDAPDVVAITLFRQLVRAETARREVFTQGRLPEFLTQPGEHVKLHLEASIRLRGGQPAQPVALPARAETPRPAVAGTCDGTAFEDFCDTDDLTRPVFEVLTANGNYYWVPTETIETVEFHKPERPRDLYWRPAHMIVREGPDGVVYVPALYHRSPTAPRQARNAGRSH